MKRAATAHSHSAAAWRKSADQGEENSQTASVEVVLSHNERKKFAPALFPYPKEHFRLDL